MYYWAGAPHFSHFTSGEPWLPFSTFVADFASTLGYTPSMMNNAAACLSTKRNELPPLCLSTTTWRTAAHKALYINILLHFLPHFHHYTALPCFVHAFAEDLCFRFYMDATQRHAVWREFCACAQKEPTLGVRRAHSGHGR